MTDNKSNQDEGPSGTQNDTPMANQVEAVSRVTIKAPPFWKANPALWFCQLEAQFHMNRITSDTHKYYTVVAAIESTILHQVSDLVLTPPEQNMYKSLKQRLLDVFAVSEQSRLKKLLGEIQIADQKPSCLLREMRNLAGTSISSDILKTLWLQRLPSNIQAILSISSEDLDKLVTMADKIFETSSGPEINKIVARAPDHSLEAQMAELTRQVSELTSRLSGQANNRHRSTSRSGARPRASTPRQHSKNRSHGSSDEQKICWYHSKWGDKASKCIGNCSFQSNAGN